MTKSAIFQNSRWKTASILKIALSPYLSRELSDFDQIWYTDTNFYSEHANWNTNTGHMTNTAIFQNSRWRTAAILKIALSPYLSRELSDFDQIWYTDANFHSKQACLTKRSKFFKFKMVDGRHIEYCFWLSRRHIGRLMPISEWMKNHMQISVTRTKRQFSDSRHFETSFISISQSELSDFDQIWCADANFHSDDGYLTKIEIFQIEDGGRTPY